MTTPPTDLGIYEIVEPKSHTPPPGSTTRPLVSGRRSCSAKQGKHRHTHSRDGCDAYEVFGSGMDATSINKSLFNMPTNSVAKRNAVLDRDNSEFWKVPRQRTSMSDVSGPHGSPASDAVSCEGPFPLNRTLDHCITSEELAQRESREAAQLERLMSRIGESGPQQIVKQRDTEQLLICMTGLPGRGKTYTARRIMRYLSWLGVRCQVFNVAVYRRKNVGYPNASFFDQSNDETSTQLMQVLKDALADTLQYFRDNEGQVAIFDGTNHSLERRQIIKETMSEVLPLDRMLFIEMHDDQVIDVDMFPQNRVTLMPEYVDRDPAEAIKDFKARVTHYQKAYETIQKSEGVPYVKYSKGHMSMYRVEGYLQKRLLFLLMNLTVMDRNIFLCLTGETMVEGAAAVAPAQGDVGLVDPGQLEKGLNAVEESRHLRKALRQYDRTTSLYSMDKSIVYDEFGKQLLDLLRETVPTGEPVTVWSSQDTPGQQTVAYLKEAGYPIVYWRYLGEFGFSVVQKMMGETWEDMVERLEPIVFEIERCETHLLICGHRGVINALYGYLAEADRAAVPPRSIVRVQPRAYDLDLQVFMQKDGRLTPLNQEMT